MRICTVFLAVLSATVMLQLHLTNGAAAEPYPSKTIKIVSRGTPGSPLDAMVRLVAQQIQTKLGQSVVVEPRAGAGGTAAAKAVASSEPDGHTLLATSTGHYYGLYPDPGYDPVRSFAPIAMLASASHVLVVAPNVPATTVEEFIEYARANPGKVAFGFGLGTPPQILGEMLKRITGTEIASIPYRGGAQAITDMLGGRIQMNFGTVATLSGLIEQRRIRPLAFTGIKRSPDLPDVPTMVEVGYPQLALNPDVWWGLLAPVKTPRHVVEKLNDAVNDGLRSASLRAAFAKMDFEVRSRTIEDFASFIAAEAGRWPPLVKAAGMTQN